VEIVTNFLPMFSTDSLYSKRSAELLYTSYILYKIVCSNLCCVFIRTYSLCMFQNILNHIYFSILLLLLHVVVVRISFYLKYNL